MATNSPVDREAVDTSLDAPETSGTKWFGYAAWRRRTLPVGEWEATLKTIESLEPEPDPDSPPELIRYATRFERLIACRTRAVFMRHRDDGSVKVMSNTCKDRWCPMCAQSRARRIAGAVRDWAETLDHPKLLTLTLQSSDVPLGQQIDRMVLAFNRMRKEQPFKRAWAGGIWFFQTTWSESRQQWHPHIHAILDGAFVAQSSISAAWERLTGDSRVVDIRTIKNIKTASNYVSRYVARPSDLEPLPEQQRTEIVEQLKGRRLVNTFGTAHRAGLLKKEPIDRTPWVRVGSWSTVTGLLGQNAAANEIWKAWRSHKPCPGWATLSDVDDALNGVIQTPTPPPRTIQLEFGT
jgi:hypothetical protein